MIALEPRHSGTKWNPIGALAQQFRPTRQYETGDITSNGYAADKNDEALLVELEDCNIGTALTNAFAMSRGT
jgi:hypothetical protein